MSDTTLNRLDPAATDETSENARDGARKRRDPSEPEAVVGLGASAGGIAPLQEFFGAMPLDSGMAFVVVMHLSPEHESNLASILQQKTKMPVTQVTGPVQVRPNHVYVIPPNNQLMFEDSTLRLIEPQQAIGRRVTIDLFFRTLAQAYGQRAVCVILSGTDSDGAIGLKHVRAQGGVTIAQDPNEAQHDSMPVTAISTGMVDWVIPVSDMPSRLMEFVRNEREMRLPPEIANAEEEDLKEREAPGGETISEETREAKDEEAVARVLADLRAQTGHDFSHYKRATILRRIARRLQVNSIESVPKYLEFLRSHSSEGRALLQDLLIGVTHFFRDREAFAGLETHIPQLFAGKRRDDTVRVWVAGCATGEEAYSLAILLCEHAARLDNPPSIQIFASDVDEQAIADARDGLYPSTIEADVSPERLRGYFVSDHGRYRVRKEVREKVLFASHNVLKDAPFSRLDMVSCRNLLIYLNARAQAEVFDIFHFALNSGGLLFIGGAESNSNANSLFRAVDAKHRLYVRRSVPRPSWKVPMLPLGSSALSLRATRGLRLRGLPAMRGSEVEDAAHSRPDESIAGQSRREVLFGELHLKLLEQYGPPSVVINQAQDLVHLSEHAGRYLQFVAGEATSNLLKVVHPALRIELRTTLFRAQQENRFVRGAPQPIEIEGQTESVVVAVRPIEQQGIGETFYLIVFERQDRDGSPAPAAPALPEETHRELDDEIQYLKEQLSATVEQYEAANEELKAANEELQAMNEEMRSATEELETSKEELQSVNEELSTVNHELKSNVEELSRANADLNNLMASTDIGTVFLDRQLRIQRFTPSAQKIFNLIPADLGRPLADITHKLAYQAFLEDAEQVLRDLATAEREVRVGAGEHWYLTRIAPYRTGDDRIAGVVATFIDITRRKQAENELRESEARIRRAFEIETVGVIFFHPNGQISDANDAFLRMSGYTREDLESHKVRWDRMTPDEWMARSGEAIAEFLEQGKTTTYEKEYVRKDGTRWWGLFSSTRISEDLGVEYILDISDTKRAEKARRESEERFRQFAENSADVLWIIDAQTLRLEFLGPAFDRMWGAPSAEILQNPDWALSLVHHADRDRVRRFVDRLLAGEIGSIDYRITRRNDGVTRWMRDTGFPIRAEGGEVRRIAGVVQDISQDKERSEALAESEERFRLLVDGTPDFAMILLDPANRIIFWSSGAERVFGWSSDEALGKHGSLIFTPEDRAVGREEEELKIALQKGAASDRRWHICKDGTRVWIDGVMRRIDEEDGSLRGFAKIARDATELRLAEEALEKSHSELEHRVAERTKELTALNTQLQTEMKERALVEQEVLLVSEREKRRIGQDLHDSLCQELAAASFFLETAAHKASPAEATSLSEAARIVNANVGLARDLARGLHPVELGASGLSNALRELAFRTSQHHDAKCLFECPRQVRIRDEAVALNLYRIAQEAVTNALKNGKATEITIRLARTRTGLSLKVQDNGLGFSDKTPRKGMGIHIMKYRAGFLGAALEIKSRPGRGTTVTCVLK